MSEDLSVALIKYNKKTWCKSALLGFFVGLAVIVPGISGSTVAIIFKLYDKFLYALGNLFKRFKECATFLLPIAIGVVIGLVLGFIGVKELLAVLPFAVVGLFAGLMCGAFPAVKDELKGAERTPLRVVLFIVGIIVPIAVGSVSAILSAKEAVGEQVNRFASVQWWQIVIALPIGYLLGITQIVPGLSASAILMAIGWFSSLVDSVSLTFWTQNPAMLLVYIALGVGFLAALVTFSKALTTAFEKGRHTAYSLIVGLSLGSIVSMFINGDIVAVYAAWSQNGVACLDLALGVVLFAAGVIGSYMLVKYQRKHDEKSCE